MTSMVEIFLKFLLSERTFKAKFALLEFTWSFFISKEWIKYIKRQKDSPKYMGHVQIAPRSMKNKKRTLETTPYLNKILTTLQNQIQTENLSLCTSLPK